MGLISRKLFPACGNMCICCPALRSRSRQPVKRYKKLLADIFPKFHDSTVNDRKIDKLCEYAAKNPVRIPKIAKYLEERCHKELRSEHIRSLNIIAETYNKLLSKCRDQMAYFAGNVLNVFEFLDESKRDDVRIIGCQVLTKFIYSQVDSTYAYNLEKLVLNVCSIANSTGEDQQKRCLRAAGLQCLSAMVWFMGTFSHIFDTFSEIVHAALKNYEADTQTEDAERGETQHNWVDEVVRSRVANSSPSRIQMRPRPDKKDPSRFTTEEVESPEVWARLCIERMAELAQESTTLRQVLDSMFVYFDTGKHWMPPRGLALVVLSDMSYFMETSGNSLLILASVIRHLDHKNAVLDLQIKTHIIRTATALARQIRSATVLVDVGFVSDLFRHFRKSVQTTIEFVEQQELKLNITFQNAAEDLLLEIAKGIVDSRPLFDMMTLTLEKLPLVNSAARATMGSLIVVAHMISLASLSSLSQQVFPDALLLQLLKVMLHSDVEVRVGGHHIFSILLFPNSNYRRYDVSNYTRRCQSNCTSTFQSVASLLEKLRRGKEESKLTVTVEDVRGRDVEGEIHQGWPRKTSPNFQKLSSIIDRTAGSADAESCTLKLNEDQVSQVLSALWLAANLPDNLPTNIEAISHSFCLTLISYRLRIPKGGPVVQFFQFPLTLMKISLDPKPRSFTPVYQRMLFVLSATLLMFAARMFQNSDLIDLMNSIWGLDQVDPYVGTSDDFQVYVKHESDAREYGSTSNIEEDARLISQLHSKFDESEMIMLKLLVENLSNFIEVDAEELMKLLSEEFLPDEAFIFGAQSMLNYDEAHSKESPPHDGECQMNLFPEDDVISEFSVSDLSRFIPQMPMSPSPSMPHVSIAQLLESALVVAGQVAGNSISTSPLPYSAMTSQCEALGTDTRRKLSNWLTHDTKYMKSDGIVLPSNSALGLSAIKKITIEDGHAGTAKEPWLGLRLPPASPFDNFLRAARG